LLFLALIQEREKRRGKLMTRAQIAEVTLKTLWNRQRLSEQFLDEVREWLMSAGWTLFYAGPIFGAVKIEAVKNWPSVAAWRIKPILAQVNEGSYDFGQLEDLFPPVYDDIPEAHEKDDR
jgi:hypothetical protein